MSFQEAWCAVEIVQLLAQEESQHQSGGSDAGVELSPCFSIFLARTTFVLESLPEAKSPGQDAIFDDFVFNSSNY